MALEQVMRRLKAALVSDLGANLDKWDAPSTPSSMPSLTLEDIPESRIYLYEIEETGFDSYPCMVLEVPTTEATRFAAPQNRTRNLTHRIDVKTYVTDTDLETRWTRNLRTARAVADTLMVASYGSATANSGIPFDVNVIGEDYGDIPDENGGMVGASILNLVVRERVTASYASI